MVTQILEVAQVAQVLSFIFCFTLIFISLRVKPNNTAVTGFRRMYEPPQTPLSLGPDEQLTVKVLFKHIQVWSMYWCVVALEE